MRVAIEKREMDVGQKEKKDEKASEKTGGSNTEVKGGHPLSTILFANDSHNKNVTLKARILELAVEANIDDRESLIIKNTQEHIKNVDTFAQEGKIITVPKDMNLSPYAQGLIEYYNANKLYDKDTLSENYYNALTDAIARDHMIALANKNLGWGLK